jgi:hypothetical protein
MTAETDIEIVGVDVDRVSQPTNDGTAGSALYRVPIKLSGQPSRQWGEALVHFWDHPPQYTTMHRPGIASVSGDRIILDGTTVEEVRDVHAKTLKLVVPLANQKVAELEAEARAKEERAAAQQADHEDNVKRVAEDIDFS